MKLRKKREYRELENPHYIPLLAGSLLLSAEKAVFYKSISNFNFYTVDSHICFKTNEYYPRIIVVGQVGVSDDTMLLEDFYRVLDFLDMKDILQGSLF